MTRRSLFAAIALVCVLFTACNDNELNTLARRLKEISTANQVVHDTVTQANKQGLLSDSAAAPLLKICREIERAALQAKDVTSKLQALSPEDKKNVLAIVLPIIEAVGGAESPVAQIQNEKLRKKIQTSLLLSYTALNATKILLQE